GVLGSTQLGSLLICGVTNIPQGQTVSQFLAAAQLLLGGGTAAYAPVVADSVASDINSAFSGGAPSTFAQEHLFVGSCPCTPGTPGCPWQTGDLVTHTQFGWDSTTSWVSAYDVVYDLTFGEVEIGIPGTSGYSALFTSATRVTVYFVANLNAAFAEGTPTQWAQQHLVNGSCPP